MKYKTVFQNIVNIDMDGHNIQKYDPKNLYNEVSVVEKSEFLQLVNRIKLTGILPIENVKIHFNDNVWDFTGAIIYTSAGVPRINFKNVPIEYLDIVKHYIFQLIMFGNYKIVTISDKLETLYNFLKYLVSLEIPLNSLNPIITDEYIREQRVKNAEVTVNKSIVVIKDFLISYSDFYQQVDLEKFKDSILYEDNSSMMSADRIAGKTPDIPEEYFDDMIKGLLEIIKTKREIKERYYDGNLDVAIACLLLIASQIGIRTGELLFLKVGAVKTRMIKSKDGLEIKTYMLTYESWKTTEFDNEVYTADTAMNELAKYAYDILTEIFKEKREEIGTDFLFMSTRKNKLPIRDTSFQSIKLRFLIENRHVLKCVNLPEEYKEQLSYFTVADARKSKVLQGDRISVSDDEVIFYPTITQFRVHVITELLKAGLDIQYIKEYMGHLYAETTAGYNRVSSKLEKPENTTAMYEDIIENDIKIIGPFGKEYGEKINECINNFNDEHVYKDIHQIAKIVLDLMPTRIKDLGVCIKPEFSRNCMKDAGVDEFYCAYGVCQYIHHTFFMVEQTHQKYQLLVASYESNLAGGFTRFAEKEKFKLINLINSMLIPELEELSNEIKKHGLLNIIDRYNNLKYIVENIEEITLEVGKWLPKQKLKKQQQQD